MKSYRVEYVQLAGWDADVAGLWLAENPEWLLLRANPGDYVVGGYVLVAKQHIISRKPHPYRRQVEQLFRLKQVEAKPPADFAFANTVVLLQWVERHYGLVEFAEAEQRSFLGWVRASDTVHVWVTLLHADGSVSATDAQQPFLISEIQLIRFDTDYFNSMKLLWQHRLRSSCWKPGVN